MTGCPTRGFHWAQPLHGVNGVDPQAVCWPQIYTGFALRAEGVKMVGILECFWSSALHLTLSACLLGSFVMGCGSTGDGSHEGGEAVAARVASQDLVLGSNYSGNYEIYLMAQDGTNVRQLTNDPA